MSQIQYIQGFYAFWDGLLQRHPHLLIDNCAEGARKIDLETIRRSMVLWRSDCQAPVPRWRVWLISTMLVIMFSPIALAG